MYKLTITKMVENPNYETQMEAIKEWEKDRYGRMGERPPYPEKMIEEKSLVCELSEDEFKAVKKAALESIS